MTDIIESQTVNGATVELKRYNAGTGFSASTYCVTVNGEKVFGSKDFGYKENNKAWEAICFALLIAAPKAEAA